MWARITTDKWVLSIVAQGYFIEFLDLPRVGHVRYTPFSQPLWEEVQMLLSKGAISPLADDVLSRCFFSRYFLIKKCSGGLRPILDLRALNKHVIPKKFRMVTLNSIMPLLYRGAWFATIDIKDAYFHLSIARYHQRYLAFMVGRTAYCFNVLPFGLSSAPRVFTKCMSVVAAYLHTKGISVYLYIDDRLVVAESHVQLNSQLSVILPFIQSLGLVINEEKSALIPSQRIQFIGALLDSTTERAYLPEDRFANLQGLVRQAAHAPFITARQVQTLLGHMASATAVIPYARLRMRPLQSWFISVYNPIIDSQEIQLSIPETIRKSLRCWEDRSWVCKGYPFHAPRPTCTVTTDSSLSGWGAHTQGLTAHGEWSEGERTAHINLLELLAVDRALKLFERVVRGQTIQILTDNTTVMFYLNKQGGTHSLPLLDLTLQIWDWCLERGIHLMCAGRGEHTSGFAQQESPVQPRMVPQSRGIRQAFSGMGTSRSRSIHDPDQCQMRPLLRTETCFLTGRMSGGRFPTGMDGSPNVCFSALSPLTEGGGKDSEGELTLHSGDPMVAKAALVLPSSPHVPEGFLPVPEQSRPVANTRGPGSISRGAEAKTDGLESPAEPLVPISALSKDIQAIIEAAHKASTRKSYIYKWSRFCTFVRSKGVDPNTAPISVILDFLVSLSDAGLSHSSLKCYLAAVSWFRRKKGLPSCFSHPLVRMFLKGIANTRPSVAPIPPAWSLELVLSFLTKPPFEPLATTHLSYLSWKTAFLVAITSARRASELCALRVDPPYFRLHKDKVVLQTDVAFLPKVSSFFHMSQEIILPSFFQCPSTPMERTLHLLDVRRALAYYVDRTTSLRKTPRLFIKYRKDMEGLPVSSQRFSSWNVSTIKLCYHLSGKNLPLQVKGHSTRVMSTTTAFMRGVPLEVICRAAIWTNPLSFVSHYKLDIASKRDADFGRAVLFSAVA
nr:mediator of RNA polymerase II transcription subunit 19 isoform X1 [Anolis sagrei ordinatus]